MSSSKDFANAVFELVQQRLIVLGFRKRKQQIFSLSVAEDVLGLLGLNKATGGRGPGILEINPVVGVRNQAVERLVAELVGEPFDELNPFSAGANIGYLSPESKYQPFIFREPDALNGPTDQLVDAIRIYGLPFISSNVSLPTLLETMRSPRFALQVVAVYRIPVALYFLGKCAEADAFLKEEFVKLGSRTDPAAQRFRAFASRLQAAFHTAPQRSARNLL